MGNRKKGDEFESGENETEGRRVRQRKNNESRDETKLHELLI